MISGGMQHTKMACTRQTHNKANMHDGAGRNEEGRLLQLSKNTAAAHGQHQHQHQHQHQQVAEELSTQQLLQLAMLGPVAGRVNAPSRDASVRSISTSTTRTLSSASMCQEKVVSSSRELAVADTSAPNVGGRRRRRPAHNESLTAEKAAHDEETIHALRAENNRIKEEMGDMRRALHRSSAVTTQDDQTELIMQLKLEIAELSTSLDEARMATLVEKGAGDRRLAELQSLFAETQRQLVEAKRKGGSATSTGNKITAVEHDTSSAPTCIDEARFRALQDEKAKSDQEAANARRELDEAKRENQRFQRVQEITRSLQTGKVDQTNDKIEELEKQLTKSKVQIADLKSDLEGSEHTSNHLMEETSQLAEQISSMKQEQMNSVATIKKYKHVLSSMKQSLAKFQTDKIGLRVRLEGAEVLAEDFKKRYIRLGESFASISLEDMENLLHEEDFEAIQEERARKDQEKKGKFRRMFEGSTIGMALTETIAPSSGEKAGGGEKKKNPFRVRRSILFRWRSSK